MKKLLIIISVMLVQNIYSQDSTGIKKIPEENVSEKNPLDIGELKIKLNSKGDQWIKLGISSQIWLRSIENNPGTSVNGVPQEQTYDAGIRRMRLIIQSQVTPFLFCVFTDGDQ